MRIVLKVNEAEQDERIEVYASEVSGKLHHALNQFSKEMNERKLYGKCEDMYYPLSYADICRFYTENKQVVVEVNQRKMYVSERLYQLEECLPSKFVRISKSEIINLDYIEKLSIELNGFIKIHFKNGIVTYSSRRYLNKIKEALQL